MIGNLKRRIKPIVVIDQDGFRACFDLVKLAKETRWDHESDQAVPVDPKIEINMKNGDEFRTRLLDEFFTFENKGGNPIETVEISGGDYGSNYIRIKLGHDWSSRIGAEITVQGEPEFSRKIVAKFEDIIRKDRPVSEIIPSLNPWIISPFLVLLILYPFMGRDRFYEDFIGRGGDEDFLKFFSLIVLSSFFVAAIVNGIQSYIYGRAVFFWSDGKTRHEKNITVTNYIFWSVPIGLFLKEVGLHNII